MGNTILHTLEWVYPSWGSLQRVLLNEKSLAFVEDVDKCQYRFPLSHYRLPLTEPTPPIRSERGSLLLFPESLGRPMRVIGA